jgi:Amt family ammonium transporter
MDRSNAAPDRKKNVGWLVVFGALLFSTPVVAQDPALAQESADAIEALSNQVNWLWTVVAACLVFFMQAGFAFVEAGMVRAKNLINIMMKNLADLSIGTLGFWAIGFGIMFSGDVFEFFPNPNVEAFGEDPNWMYAFMFFQAVFAATAATIVSGAMAERTKFGAYLVSSLIITAIIYPISGSWAWGSLWHGGGWLETMGFVDFAGSTVVHSVGGWAALAAAIVLGPRLGKFNKDGTANALPAHNMGMATLGMLILWFGWFGFNAGSTTSMDGGNFARIAYVTSLSAGSGALVAMLTNWVFFKYPDLSMTINGALAGLVSITAGCYTMTPGGAIITGGLGGALVIFSILGLQKLKIDDPVGAISVHGVCGAWGTLACAIPFLTMSGQTANLGVQLAGIGAVFAFVFSASFLMFFLIKKTIGLRVTEEEELQGLDIFEHGGTSYLFDSAQ